MFKKRKFHGHRGLEKGELALEEASNSRMLGSRESSSKKKKRTARGVPIEYSIFDAEQYSLMERGEARDGSTASIQEYLDFIISRSKRMREEWYGGKKCRPIGTKATSAKTRGEIPQLRKRTKKDEPQKKYFGRKGAGKNKKKKYRLKLNSISCAGACLCPREWCDQGHRKEVGKGGSITSARFAQSASYDP